MKRIFAWSVALALLGMLAACAGERPATETTTTANSAASEQLPMHTGFSLEKLPAGDLVWEAQPMPFPKPPAERFGVRGGLLICHGVGERAFAAYQKALAADGWRQFFRSEESESNADVWQTYIKENQTLGVIAQSFEAEDDGSVLINYDAGYVGAARTGDFRKEAILPLIQKGLKKSEKVTALVEKSIPNANETTKMQLFDVYGKRYHLGMVLVCGESVLSLWASGDYCVGDLDADGEEEFTYMYGLGSGIWRMNITVCKYGSPPGAASAKPVLYEAAQNTWYPNNGYAELRFVPIGTAEVKLFGVAEDAEGSKGLGADYGLLRMQGNKVVPTNSERFPFREEMDPPQS